MNKKVLLVLGLMLGAINARASWEVRSELLGNCTSFAVTVASAPATQLLSASLSGTTTTFLRLMENRTWLEIQNSTGNAHARAFVMFSLSSTTLADNLTLSAPPELTINAGRMIPADGTYAAPIPARNQDGRILVPWAMNGSGVGSTVLQVTQCKP